LWKTPTVAFLSHLCIVRRLAGWAPFKGVR
jgi:hypothetical protein